MTMTIIIEKRPYYTMRCFTGVFYFSSHFFSLRFSLCLKTQEKRKKIAKRNEKAINVSILHYTLGKNTFFSRFSQGNEGKIQR